MRWGARRINGKSDTCKSGQPEAACVVFGFLSLYLVIQISVQDILRGIVIKTAVTVADSVDLVAVIYVGEPVDFCNCGLP